jgi:hypothetical protein
MRAISTGSVLVQRRRQSFEEMDSESLIYQHSTKHEKRAMPQSFLKASEDRRLVTGPRVDDAIWQEHFRNGACVVTAILVTSGIPNIAADFATTRIRESERRPSVAAAWRTAPRFCGRTAPAASRSRTRCVA